MIQLEFIDSKLSIFELGLVINRAIIQIEFMDFNLSKETNKQAFCKIVIIISCLKLENKTFGVHSQKMRI